MKKEAFVAIVLGIGLGFVVTFGIWKAKGALSTLPPSPVSPTSSPRVLSDTNPPQPQELLLKFNTPQDNDLVNTETTLISGQTSPGAYVMLIGENSQSVLIADATGKFQEEITLLGGINDITLFAFDPTTSQSARSEISIVYSTAEI